MSAYFYLFLLFCFTFQKSLADIYNADFITPKEVTEAKQNEIDHQKRQKYPNVKIGFINEIFFDNLVRDNQSGASNSNGRGYTYMRGFFNFGITKNIFLNSNIALQPVSSDYNHPYGLTSYANGNNSIRSFNRHGIIMEELNLSYRDENVEIFLGKFNPIFGAGAQRYSKVFDNDWYGINGTQTNFGYQLREKLGARLDLTILNDREVFFTGVKNKKTKNEDFDDDFLEDEGGEELNSSENLFHQFLRLSAAIYKNDTSSMFDSAISSKNPVYYNNAAGTDSRYRSYSLALDGYIRSKLSKTVINLSNRTAYNNDIKMSNESGNAYALEHVFYLPNRVKLGGFAEYVKLNNFAGISNARQTYTTLSGFMGVSGITLSYVVNKFKTSGVDTANTNIYYNTYNNIYQPFLSDRYNSREVSIGYEFTNGIAIKLGRKKYFDIYSSGSKVNNVEADQVSLRYRINY